MQERDAADLLLVENAVRKAGEIARHYFGGEFRRWSKSRGEPVTEADLASKSMLVLRTGKKSYYLVRFE